MHPKSWLAGHINRSFTHSLTSGLNLKEPSSLKEKLTQLVLCLSYFFFLQSCTLYFCKFYFLRCLMHGYSYQVEAWCPIMPWRKHVYSNPSGDKVQKEQVIAYFCFTLIGWLEVEKRKLINQAKT